MAIIYSNQDQAMENKCQSERSIYLGQIVYTSQFEEILQRLEDLMERLKGNDQEISKYCDWQNATFIAAQGHIYAKASQSVGKRGLDEGTQTAHT